MTTIPKTGTTGAMQEAAGKGTSANIVSGCKDCVKQGLAILPVVPVPVPMALRTASNDFAALDSSLAAPDLAAHWLLLRSLPTGYLYVLKNDSTWDCYVVDVDGMLRMTAVSDAPAAASEMAPLSGLCVRWHDNIPAQVIAIDPVKHPTVWMVFTRYRWNAKILGRYASNQAGCRDKRMTKLDVKAAAAGSLGSEGSVQNSLHMSANVGASVADYASRDTCDKLNEVLATPVHYRADQGVELAARMAKISSQTACKTGAIIVLDDQLGMTIEVNAQRNAEVARMGAYMQEHQRERVVSDIIQGAQRSFNTHGDGDSWSQRYAKHYNNNKLLGDKFEYESNIRAWQQSIDRLTVDVIALKRRLYWGDFDPADDQSARDRVTATALCVHGGAMSSDERSLWATWLAEEPNDPNATLWGAVTALDAKFGEFVLGKGLPSTGKLNKFRGIVKNVYDGFTDFGKILTKRASAMRMSMICTAMTSELSHMEQISPALYELTAMRMLAVGAVHTQTAFVSVIFPMTEAEQAVLMAEATFGPAASQVKTLLNLENVANQQGFVVRTNGVDNYASAADAGEAHPLRAVEMLMPEAIAQSLSSGAKDLNPFDALAKYSKTTPGVFAWVGLLLQSVNLLGSLKDLAAPGAAAKTDNWLPAFSGALGVIGVMTDIYAKTMKERAPTFATTAEATAGTTATAKVAFGGGVLACLSSITDFIVTLRKGVARSDADDSDASDWYVYSSIFTLASGLASFGSALGAATTAGLLPESIGLLYEVGTAAATVPGYGWAIAAVLLAAGSLITAWEAIEKTDDPMEQWLQHCYYGMSERFTVKQEMDALNDIAYAMAIHIEWKSTVWAFEGFDFFINLPQICAESTIQCKVTLTCEGRTVVAYDDPVPIRPKISGNVVEDPRPSPWLPPQAPTQYPASAAAIRDDVGGSFTPQHPLAVDRDSMRRERQRLHQAKKDRQTFRWAKPMRIWRDGTRGLYYGGTLEADGGVFSSAEIAIAFRPHSLTMPTFVLPSDGQRITFSQEEATVNYGRDFAPRDP